MARLCTVCHHPERDAIDRALVAGEANSRIAANFGLKEQNVRRHKALHLPLRLLHAQAVSEVMRDGDLLAEANRLYQQTLVILRRAEATADLRTALAAIREARECLDSIVRLTERADRKSRERLLDLPEWRAISALIFAALDPYPDVREVVARQLLALEATNGSRG